MKLIIAGGRAFDDYRLMRAILDNPLFDDVTEVVSGRAPGADTLGERWADEEGIPVTPFPAQWRRYGRAIAGKRRNQQMADYADALVAFHGDRGTADMVERMRRAGQTLHRREVLAPLITITGRVCVEFLVIPDDLKHWEAIVDEPVALYSELVRYVGTLQPQVLFDTHSSYARLLVHLGPTSMEPLISIPLPKPYLTYTEPDPRDRWVQGLGEMYPVFITGASMDRHEALRGGREYQARMVGCVNIGGEDHDEQCSHGPDKHNENGCNAKVGTWEDYDSYGYIYCRCEGYVKPAPLAVRLRDQHCTTIAPQGTVRHFAFGETL